VGSFNDAPENFKVLPVRLVENTDNNKYSINIDFQFMLASAGKPRLNAYGRDNRSHKLLACSL